MNAKKKNNKNNNKILNNISPYIIDLLIQIISNFVYFPLTILLFKKEKLSNKIKFLFFFITGNPFQFVKSLLNGA
jgi:hypothetical protein